MKLIPLTQGKFAVVDDADFAAVNAHKWCAYRTCRGHFYAKRNIRKPDGKQVIQFLHHFLMPGVRVDHRDGNGLNNQRENLRSATRQQNGRGFRRKKRGATSKFRGVTWLTVDKKWQAQLGFNGEQSISDGFQMKPTRPALTIQRPANILPTDSCSSIFLDELT